MAKIFENFPNIFFFFLKSFARPAASTTTSLKHGRHGLSEAWLYFSLNNTSYSLRYTVYNIAFSEAWSRVQASPPAQSDVFPCRPACLLLLCYLLGSGVDVPSLPSAVNQVQVRIPVSPKQDFAAS